MSDNEITIDGDDDDAADDDVEVVDEDRQAFLDAEIAAMEDAGVEEVETPSATEMTPSPGSSHSHSRRAEPLPIWRTELTDEDEKLLDDLATAYATALAAGAYRYTAETAVRSAMVTGAIPPGTDQRVEPTCNATIAARDARINPHHVVKAIARVPLPSLRGVRDKHDNLGSSEATPLDEE